MPELPEVETIKRDLEKVIIGKIIDDVVVYDDRVIKGLGKITFRKKLRGKTFASVTRRAKAIIVTFTDQTYFIVQVKMTGYLVYRPRRAGQDRGLTGETKVVFKLSTGDDLLYNDHRTFGWLILSDQLSEVDYLNNAGVEPLESEFSEDWLTQAVFKRNVSIKPLLMNHNVVAGIGNIYASEILFRSGINPGKKACALVPDEIRLLHKSTIDILKEAIVYRGTSMRNYRDASGEKGKFLNRIKVYGKDGGQCPRCHGVIVRVLQAGRSTFYCPDCQT